MVGVMLYKKGCSDTFYDDISNSNDVITYEKPPFVTAPIPDQRSYGYIGFMSSINTLLWGQV
jgi:hypothetical protein